MDICLNVWALLSRSVVFFESKVPFVRVLMFDI